MVMSAWLKVALGSWHVTPLSVAVLVYHTKNEQLFPRGKWGTQKHVCPKALVAIVLEYSLKDLHITRRETS
jgi:hypothetical protein